MASQAAVRVEPAGLAAVFATNEPIALPVSAAGDAIAWILRDAGGRPLSRGREALAGGRAVLRPPPPGRGYFELELTVEQAGRVTETAMAALAVVPPPRPPLPASPFGVMTHFAQGWSPELVPLVTRLGIGHVRDEQYWHRVEQQAGSYAYPAAFVRYMEALQAAGIEPLLEATFANPLYDQGKTPHTDTARRAYGLYAAELAHRYAGQARAIEIWNEYNGSFCDGPACADRPRSYAAMLKEAYGAVKQAAPGTIVVGGAAVLAPLPYLTGVFREGGLAAMDALAVHPYRSVPEGVELDIEAVRQAMRIVGGTEKPIWATEVGFGNVRTDRFDVARYLVRLMTLLRAAGVERIYWYLLRDYDTFTGMGLLRDEASPLGRYAPTPAYVAYATLTDLLEAAPVPVREPTDPRSRVYRFGEGAAAVRILWSTDLAARFELAADTRAIDYLGRPVVTDRGWIEVGADPVYLIGGTAPRERRADVQLAGSADDYAETQGRRGWSYGRMEGPSGTAARSLPIPGTRIALQFLPLDQVNGAWGAYWSRVGYRDLKLDRRSTHPSTLGGRDAWAVRRWTSGFAGPARIAGSVALAESGGDGIGVMVMVDDVVIFSASLGGGGPQSLKFDLPASLAQGSRVDFVVTPGPAGRIDHDGAAFDAVVTRAAS